MISAVVVIVSYDIGVEVALVVKFIVVLHWFKLL